MRGSTGVILVQLIAFLFLCTINHIECKTPSKEELKAYKFPPCAACRVLANSIKYGIDRTRREKFDGGDSMWEKDNLGSYAKSEVRLIEIQENLCKEIEQGAVQCHALAEEFENIIEDWWFDQQANHPDIFKYLCIQEAQRCCPKDHYGPQCTPCPGYPDKICNNNGKCKGGGTRKGNGECICDVGYSGENCSECAISYYESYKDQDTILCSPCYIACAGICKGPGPKDCEQCKQGWQATDEHGCIDIDECLRSDEFCPKNNFCVNKEGGYTCLACDKACNGCTGDGPDMCTKCADGYHKKENLCIDTDIFGRKKQENMARYATYLGLCIATCIILQRNIYAASLIGLLVGVYISISEYIIAQSNEENTLQI